MGTSDLLKQLVTLRLPVTTDHKVGSLSLPGVALRERARRVPDRRGMSGIWRILTDNRT
jgi:hypothetical protein